MNTLKVGDKAPDFKLVDVDKNVVSLSDFRGKNVILFFFPMAWTGTCTKEMCTVQEDYKAYEDSGAVVLGVSVDSHLALQHFKKEYNLNNVILLSDFNKEAIKAYDVVHPEFLIGYKDVARRSTFVIDKGGVVRFTEVLAQQGDFPNMEAVKGVVKGLD
jgi:peroxiredoxin